MSDIKLFSAKALLATRLITRVAEKNSWVRPEIDESTMTEKEVDDFYIEDASNFIQNLVLDKLTAITEPTLKSDVLQSLAAEKVALDKKREEAEKGVIDVIKGALTVTVEDYDPE